MLGPGALWVGCTDCGTLGSDTGVGGRTVVVTVGVSGKCCGMVHWKRSESCWRVGIWSLPNEISGDVSAGLKSSSVNILAELVTLSVDDVAVMSMSRGKNSTVCAIRSALVIVI